MTSSSSSDFDVIVIGAGPAGSIAALLAARRGWRVLLLEQHQFPRRKVCGGCISAAGVRKLNAFLSNRVLPGVPEKKLTFVTPTGRTLRYRAQGRGRVVRREDLDLLLLRASEEEGAIIQQGTRGVPYRSGDRWAVRTERGLHSSTVVLVATGLTGARLLGPRSPQNIGRGTLVGWNWSPSTVPAGLELGDVEMHWLHGGYIGLSRSQATECNVALAMNSSWMNSQITNVGASSSYGRSMNRLYEANPNSSIWSRLCLGSVEPDAVKGVAGFPVQPVRLGENNLLCMGDSAGYTEPFTGDGIYLAILSAELAVRACERAGLTRDGRAVGSELVSSYSKLLARSHFARMQRTRLLGALLRQSWLHHVDRILPQGWPATKLDRLLGWVHAGPAAATD